MIESKDITFVVQGPIGNKKVACSALLSIRENFPKSSIVISTWKGEAIDGLEYDNAVAFFSSVSF